MLGFNKAPWLPQMENALSHYPVASIQLCLPQRGSSNLQSISLLWMVTRAQSQPHPRVEHCPGKGRPGPAVPQSSIQLRPAAPCTPMLAILHIYHSWGSPTVPPSPSELRPCCHDSSSTPCSHSGLCAGCLLAPEVHESSSAWLPALWQSLETAPSTSSASQREQHRTAWGQCLRHPAIPRASFLGYSWS